MPQESSGEEEKEEERGKANGGEEERGKAGGGKEERGKADGGEEEERGKGGRRVQADAQKWQKWGQTIAQGGKGREEYAKIQL